MSGHIPTNVAQPAGAQGLNGPSVARRRGCPPYLKLPPWYSFGGPLGPEILKPKLRKKSLMKIADPGIFGSIF